MVIKSGCPLYPQKRPWFSTVVMSALCHKQTFDRLFNHLVSDREQLCGKFDPNCFGGLEIEHKL